MVMPKVCQKARVEEARLPRAVKCDFSQVRSLGERKEGRKDGGVGWGGDG